MNYIELIQQFWQCNNELPIGCNATALYFYLLKVCNSLGWKETFKHSDRHIAVQLGISINTVRNAKNKLKQIGLIDFKSPEKASRGLSGSTSYKILTISNFDSVHIKTISKFDSVTDTVTDTVVDSVPDTRIKLNKTKDKNIPPTPPGGDDKELKKKEAELRKLEEKLKAKEKELSERENKNKPKKNPPNPINSKARKVFEKHFKAVFESDYYWTAKDAGSMSSILKKLEFSRKQRNLPVGESDMLKALSGFLSTINEGWIFENFSVTNINSKFNEIVSNAKSKSNAKNRTNYKENGAKQRENETDRAFVEYAEEAFRKST